MKKRVLYVTAMVVLIVSMLMATVAVAKNKSTVTVKDWLIDYIGGLGTSVSSDSQIKSYIKDNKEQFFDIYLSENVTGFDGVSLLFEAMGDETCTVTFNCEEQSNFNLLLNEVNGKSYKSNKCIKFGKTVWDFTLVVNASGLDVQPRFQRQRPNLKETDNFSFIDAIPETIKIPVPIRVINNSKEVLGTSKPSFNNGGIGAYESDPSGVKVQRGEDVITVKGLKGAGEISSEYGAVWYTKDGSAPGNSPSANQVSYTFKTAIDVLYSVSLEPITDGAKDGLPTLKVDNKLVDANASTPNSKVPLKDEFGRTLGNTSSIINRGTNSKADSTGSNANGKDIRTAGRKNVETGVRSTGFAKHGAKIAVSANPDTNKGFAVDYYNIEIFNPITCELMTSEKHLTEQQLNSILSKGIQGKTKIYVAYTNKASFLKTDVNGKAITGLDASFGIYSDKECKNLIANMSVDTKTGKVTTPALSLPTPDAGEKVKTYYIKELSAPKGYLVSSEVYKLELIHNNNGFAYKLTAETGSKTISGNGTEADPYKVVNYKVGYTMVKYRVTQYFRTDISKGKGKTAGDRTEGILPYEYNANLPAYGAEHGFLAGNTVKYNVVFKNTGDLPLTIDLKDVFESISAGGFDYRTVSAVDYKGNKLSVTGKDNTAFTLPVDNISTNENESIVTITFTCNIKKSTPIREEQSTGKTGYKVEGYESIASSSASYKSPYTNETVVYAENANGDVIPATESGAILVKSSVTYTPVTTKQSSGNNNTNTPKPTAAPQPGETPNATGSDTTASGADHPHTGDRSFLPFAIAMIAVAIAVSAMVFVISRRSAKRQ